jgi:hypothetical protein
LLQQSTHTKTIETEGPHRPASAWLTQLQRAKVEAVNSGKPRTTIQDLIDRLNGARARYKGEEG